MFFNIGLGKYTFYPPIVNMTIPNLILKNVFQSIAEVT